MEPTPTPSDDEDLEPAAGGLRTTLILTGLVVGLGLFLRFIEPDLKPGPDPLSQRLRVLPLVEEQDIVRLEARPKGGAALALVRKDAEAPAPEPGKEKGPDAGPRPDDDLER